MGSRGVSFQRSYSHEASSCPMCYGATQSWTRLATDASSACCYLAALSCDLVPSARSGGACGARFCWDLVVFRVIHTKGTTKCDGKMRVCVCLYMRAVGRTEAHSSVLRNCRGSTRPTQVRGWTTLGLFASSCLQLALMSDSYDFRGKWRVELATHGALVKEN